MACANDVAASVCGGQTGRCRTRTHNGFLANQRNLQQQMWNGSSAVPWLRLVQSSTHRSASEVFSIETAAMHCQNTIMISFSHYHW